MGTLKPARAQAGAPQKNDEVLCDLDAVISSRVTFTFQGRIHALLPITTERFFDFWDGVQKFERIEQKTPDEVNGAFFRLIHAVCDTIEPAQVDAMTVVQKATLLKHLVAKVVGNQGLFDSLEKKNSMNRQMTSQPPTESVQ